MTEHGPRAVKAADRAVQRLVRECDSCEPGGIRVVNAPAGAGKTGLVTRLIPRHVALGRRVGVITQTNEQANDLTFRLAQQAPRLPIMRLISGSHAPPAFPSTVTTTSDARAATTVDVVVATGDKWAYSTEKLAGTPFDVGIVDEAYQMAGAKLLYIADLFERLDLVGDPGQLSPFSQVETGRWTGLAVNPTKSAVDTIRSYRPVDVELLPVTRRLSPAAAELVQRAFYPSLQFGAATEPGERRLAADPRSRPSRINRVVDLAFESGWAMATLPAKVVLRNDRDVAVSIAGIVADVLARNTARIRDDHSGLDPVVSVDRIAVGASHRDQVAAVLRELGERRISGVTVDTANRLQGREYDIVVAWHPLSGQIEAESFHLDVGRLCVLTTRHRHACILVGREGIADVLDASVPIGEGILGDPVDRSISGWEANLLVLDHLAPLTVSL